MSAVDISEANVEPYGRLVVPVADGHQSPPAFPLELNGGQPTLYIMKLKDRQPVIRYIARHNKVTQTLASASGRPWFIGLAPPGYPPAREAIRLFRVPGGAALTLRKGTWHAGPYFAGSEADFFNLELTTTNDDDKDEVEVRPPIEIDVGDDGERAAAARL
ncbi:RmlC-like cupin domain-containing protein [Hyaloraphidium curvatum]|nr:RmlC-like cupin domain-containing protein [Hyaloraphidium curvatum]